MLTKTADKRYSNYKVHWVMNGEKFIGNWYQHPFIACQPTDYLLTDSGILED